MKRLLSLSGGGTSGYVSACYLEEIEKLTGRTTLQLFDSFAGVSTGSLLANLVMLGYKPRDIKKIYISVSEELFSKRNYWNFIKGKSLYSSEKLEELINVYVGLTTLGQLEKDFICYALEMNRPVLEVKTWKTWDKSQKDVKVGDILTASSSAPLAFEPKEIDGVHYYDGGLAMNDPTLIAYSELKEHYNEDITVVSLQTDLHKGFIIPESIKSWRLLLNYSGLAVDGGEYASNHVCERLIPNYVKLNPKIYLPIDSFNWTRMESVAKIQCQENKEKILELLT